MNPFAIELFDPGVRGESAGAARGTGSSRSESEHSAFTAMPTGGTARALLSVLLSVLLYSESVTLPKSLDARPRACTKQYRISTTTIRNSIGSRCVRPQCPQNEFANVNLHPHKSRSADRAQPAIHPMQCVSRVCVCVCVACSASMLARISASVCLASDDALIAASDSHGPGMETVCIMRSPGNLGLKASGVGSSSKWSVAASSVVGGEFGVANDCGKMRGGIASAD